MDTKFARVLDTNLNRAKEGLRVIEDAARFIYDDEELYKKLRDVRHNASTYLTDLYPQMIDARDSVTDPGRTAKEQERPDLKNVVIANFKRVQEALRVLEEYTKTVDFDKALKYKALRYEVYNIEKDMTQKYIFSPEK